MSEEFSKPNQRVRVGVRLPASSHFSNEVRLKVTKGRKELIKLLAIGARKEENVLSEEEIS